jgi:hypothetical protein
MFWGLGIETNQYFSVGCSDLANRDFFLSKKMKGNAQDKQANEDDFSQSSNSVSAFF